jgi:hypothetical protein
MTNNCMSVGLEKCDVLRKADLGNPRSDRLEQFGRVIIQGSPRRA